MGSAATSDLDLLNDFGDDGSLRGLTRGLTFPSPSSGRRFDSVGEGGAWSSASRSPKRLSQSTSASIPSPETSNGPPELLLNLIDFPLSTAGPASLGATVTQEKDSGITFSGIGGGSTSFVPKEALLLPPGAH
jgi:hypothetical protein